MFLSKNYEHNVWSHKSVPWLKFLVYYCLFRYHCSTELTLFFRLNDIKTELLLNKSTTLPLEPRYNVRRSCWKDKLVNGNYFITLIKMCVLSILIYLSIKYLSCTMVFCSYNLCEETGYLRYSFYTYILMEFQNLNWMIMRLFLWVFNLLIIE